MPGAMADIGHKDVKSEVLNVTSSLATGASATTKILDGVAGKKIVITNINDFHVQPAIGAAMSVTWKSDATALTGPLRFTNANQGLTTSYMPDGHFRTAAGEDLNLTLTDYRSIGSSANTNAWGSINYYYE